MTKLVSLKEETVFANLASLASQIYAATSDVEEIVTSFEERATGKLSVFVRFLFTRTYIIIC